MNNASKPYHIPVLINEVLEYLQPKADKVYVDATFGGGGHTRAILSSNQTCHVIAFDWDLKALEKNAEPLQEEFPDRLTVVWSNFSYLEKKLRELGYDGVDGILADFGTSQYQLNERAGFSFQHDTPLDMRMSPAHQKLTAAEVVNKGTEKTLIEIFQNLGEEPKSRSIARAIVQERAKKPITTTKQLALLVERITGGRAGKKIHPATKIFQALRIYVNNELDNIHAFLKVSMRILKPGGRLVCISFHSLEDRIVKQFFKRKEDEGVGEIITSKVIVASQEETAINPASRSAKLRTFELKKESVNLFDK